MNDFPGRSDWAFADLHHLELWSRIHSRWPHLQHRRMQIHRRKQEIPLHWLWWGYVFDRDQPIPRERARHYTKIESRFDDDGDNLGWSMDRLWWRRVFRIETAVRRFFVLRRYYVLEHRLQFRCRRRWPGARSHDRWYMRPAEWPKGVRKWLWRLLLFGQYQSFMHSLEVFAAILLLTNKLANFYKGGWCGSTDAHCGSGCQSGKCLVSLEPFHTLI